VDLPAAGQSLSQIARQFKVGKATIHAIGKTARTAAQAPAPTTASKPAKASRKAAAAA
jgi:transposase